MDNRLNEISSRISEYSLGEFEKRLKISPRFDDIDAIMNGLNMLGDELKAITISRDYFNNIFHSVSDMVFILTSGGMIVDANQPAETLLNYKAGSLKGKGLNDLLTGGSIYFENISKELCKQKSFTSGDVTLLTKEKVRIPVQVHASYFTGNNQRNQLILVTASDITLQKQTENFIIRAIIDTQEKERGRLAKDLHDSLTQQLSAIKFYISATADLTRNRQLRDILVKSNVALTDLIADMRNICFNLMPKTLEEFGLIKAVQEFCRHFLAHHQTKFLIQGKLPELTPELKIDLYRTIQEFITNALQHGHASLITAVFSYHKKVINVHLTDNGKGFDIHGTPAGMGLQNARSRVRSHNGTLQINSETGKGTSYTITIPINLITWEQQ